MSLTLKTGVTSIAPTGGTDKTYTVDGQPVMTGVHFADSTEADYRIQKHMTIKNRNPQRQNDGKYSKGKQVVITTHPFLKADLSVGFNKAETLIEYDPEFPAASLKDLRFMHAQMLFQAAMEAFWASRTLPA